MRIRRDLIVVLILLALPLGLFWQTTLGGKTLLPIDTLYQWAPLSAYKEQVGLCAPEAATCVPHNELLLDLVIENYVWKRFVLASLGQPGGLTNRLPLWNPYLWAGAPFLADGQHSALYPFSALFWVLPLPQAYGWFTVLQFWMAGLSMYVLARTLGASRAGGLLAGMTYQLSALYVVSTVFTMIIAAMVWLPLLLALIELVIRGQMRGGSGVTLPYVVGGALALGLQMLAGHPEFTYYSGLVMGLYAAARLIQALVARRGSRTAWQRALKSGAWLLAMVALGALIGAAQFVPLYEFAAQSFRQGSESYETIVGWAFPPRRALAFLIPDFFGNPTWHTWFDLLRGQRLPVLDNLHGEPTQPPHTLYWGVKNAVEGGSYLGLLPLLLAAIAILAAIRQRTKDDRRRTTDDARRPDRFPRQDLSGLESMDDGIRNTKYAAHTERGACPTFPTWFFAALALFSLTLVFGLPTYRLIFALPFINQLHSPFRWLFPYTLSMAVLAGLGATEVGVVCRNFCRGEACLAPTETTQHSAHDPRAGAWNWPRILGGLALGGGALGAVGLLLSLPFAERLYPLAERAVLSLARADQAFASGRQFFLVQWRNGMVFALTLAASGAVLLLSRRKVVILKRWGGIALWQLLAVGVLAADLLIAGYGFNPANDPAWLDFVPPSIAFLQARQAEDPHFRVTSLSRPGVKTLNANLPWLYDLQDARGYGSIITRQYAEYMALIYDQYELLYNRIAPLSTEQPQALDSPLLDLLNVKYVVTEETIDSPKYALVYQGEVRIYENRAVMPRAFSLPASSALQIDDLAAAVQQVDPRYHVLLDAPALAADRLADGAPQPGTPRPATITVYNHNEVYVDVDLSEPGWLILADSYAPGWRAYARPWGGGERDEREVPIQRHAGQFRAVYLEAGAHTVRYKYTPTSVKVGFFLTFLGGATLALMAIVWLWRRYAGGDRAGTEGGDARRVARNSVAPIVLQLFNKLVDMAFIMLALRILGPAGAGQYYFVVNLIVYTDVFINFGLNTYLQREIARARDEGRRYLGNAVTLRLGLSAVAAPLLALFVLGWPLFTRLLASLGWAARAEALDRTQIWALALFAIGLIPGNVAAALTALFQANERMEYPAAITVVSTLIKAALGTAALLLGWGIVGLGGVSIVTNLVTLAILAALTARLFFVPHFFLEPRLQKEMRHESWPLMVNNLLSMGFFKADVILLKAMAGDVVLGLYSSVAYKLIDAINIVPTSFTFALFPLMSRYAREGQAAREGRAAMTRAYLLAVRLLVWVALPLAMALTLLAYPIGRVIGGSGYMPDSAIALQWMIWSIPVGFVNSVTHYVLIALGRQRPLTWTFLIGLGFNVLANVLAIPVWGYRASALIHVFSELVLLAAFSRLLRRDLPPVPWGRLLWRPLAAGAAMGAAGALLYGVNVFLATGVALAVYAGALWALGIAREPDMEVLRELLPWERVRGWLAPTRTG